MKRILPLSLLFRPSTPFLRCNTFYSKKETIEVLELVLLRRKGLYETNQCFSDYCTTNEICKIFLQMELQTGPIAVTTRTTSQQTGQQQTSPFQEL